MEVHLRAPYFYLDIVSYFISPLLLSSKLRQSGYLMCMERIRRVPWFQVVWLVIILVLCNHIVGCIFFMLIEAQGLWERHIALLDHEEQSIKKPKKKAIKPPMTNTHLVTLMEIKLVHAQVPKADVLSVEGLLLVTE
ncbi:hypothetical protein Efla_000025 [Eimeria flavescens]